MNNNLYSKQLKTGSMKAVFFNNYGSSDVLSIRDRSMPEAKAGTVLIKVKAASVNPLDWRLMRADPFLVRLSFGLRKPKINGLGADFSGIVDSVADDVSDFKPGDVVSGIMAPEVVGAFAEYVSIPEDALVHKPESLSHQQAATLGVAALTAYEGNQDYPLTVEGARVLIKGASGGIGTFAVQMAKALGSQVTAVCSSRNEALVRGIGADTVIDYQSVNILQIEERFDLVFDTIGNLPAKRMKRLVSEGGRLVLASAANSLCFIKAMSLAKKDDQIELIADLKKDKPRLEAVAALAASGTVQPVIDREYPFDAIWDAIDYVATKRARGKVVVNIA